MKNDLIGLSASVLLHGALALSVVAAEPLLSRASSVEIAVPLTMAMFQVRTPPALPERAVVYRKPERPRPAPAPPRVEPAPAPEQPPEAVTRIAQPAPVMHAALEAPDPIAVSSYAQTLAALIARHRLYPRLARLRGWQGQVEVQLYIAPGGRLVDIQVSQSSGFDVLDRHALEMVQLARPLPAPPEELRGKKFTVFVPVVFRLQS